MKQASFKRTEGETRGIERDEKKNQNKKNLQDKMRTTQAKRKILLRQEKYRSESQIQVVCFVVLQRHKN